MIPLGSATKPWTAVHLMKYVEAGDISLDDAAETWVDDQLKQNGTSLRKLFGPLASDVTIGDLLGMRSGFADYSNVFVKRATLQKPLLDLDPYAYLHSCAAKKLVCSPGTCSFYSGANYVLLGFVLQELQGARTWDKVKQQEVIPSELAKSGRYKDIDFAMKGPCSRYANVAHQVASYSLGSKQMMHDLYDNSCLNGWTMGNAMGSAESMARFWYDVYNYRFVSKKTLKTMMQFEPLKNSWCPGCMYGLGLIQYFPTQSTYWSKDESVRLEGHGGTDYGSLARNCGFNKKYKFGICITFTSTRGRNCTATDSFTNDRAVTYTMCQIYRAVLKVVGGPNLTCPRIRGGKQKRVSCSWSKGAAKMGKLARKTKKTRKFVIRAKQGANYVRGVLKGIFKRKTTTTTTFLAEEETENLFDDYEKE